MTLYHPRALDVWCLVLCVFMATACADEPDQKQGCTATPLEDGSVVIQCGEDAPVTLTPPSGSPGVQGEPGQDGVDGEMGAPGQDGAQGRDGTDGTNGMDGTDGMMGAQGSAGMDGQSALLRTTFEPPGSVCIDGGEKIEMGIDANGNGVLDDDEVDESLTTRVCVPHTGPFVQVSVGGNHSCGVTLAGGVKCWGRNTSGQLGRLSNTFATRPVDVMGLPEQISAVSAGHNHTCAVTINQAVWCWGGNDWGQLGDGTRVLSTDPVPVPGLQDDVVSVHAGQLFTCALPVSGYIKCWGRNDLGQLGNGTTTPYSAVPTNVAAMDAGTRALSVGSVHVCALPRDSPGLSRLVCWGDNRHGQLGDGTTENSPWPRAVMGFAPLETVQDVALGLAHTCASNAQGLVKCWGLGTQGQLGQGADVDALVPVDVMGLGADVDSLSASALSTCALSLNGSVKCWGTRHTNLLGHGMGHSNVPVQVTGLEHGVDSLSSGATRDCVVMAGGSARCWGKGPLGNGTIADAEYPVRVRLP